MTPSLVIARPYFTLRLPASDWEAAAPPEGADIKLVSRDQDAQHTLMLLVLVARYDDGAPDARATAFGRLCHVYDNYRQSNASQGAHTVTDDLPPDDEPGMTWNAGYTLDFGGTVLRRHIRSVLPCPALFGDHGKWQVMVNVALYTQHAGRNDGQRRFDQVLEGLDVAPAAFGGGLSGPAANHLSPPPRDEHDEDDEEPAEPADPRTFLPWIVSRTWLAQFARVFPVWGVNDPTQGMTPLGHDLFLTVARPAREMPPLMQILLLPGPELVATAFDNIAARGDELIGQRHFTPRGQPVLVFHGNRLAAAFTLLAMFQSSFAESLGTRRLLACFPRPDVAAVFADGPAEMREEARRFVLSGAGDVTLSDRLFELTGVGGARPLIA